MTDLFTALVSKLPPTVSTIFVIVFVLGFVSIVFGISFYFLWKSFRYYVDKRSESKPQDSAVSVFKLAMTIQDKITNITKNMAGKYVTKEELKEVNAEINKAIEAVKTELAKDIDTVEEELKRIKRKLTAKD